jgi:regulatory protein
VRQRLSLRAQAVAWLAQREHSELELRRKLSRRLAAEAASPDLRPADHRPEAAHPDPASADATPADVARPDAAEQVDAVIRWLLERGYLDPQRFIDSRVHVRAGRYGLGRIRQELAQHGLALAPETAQALRSTEVERANSLWQRRFGELALTPRDAARQARFLAGRGFSGEVVRQVLREAAALLRSEAPEAGLD